MDMTLRIQVAVAKADIVLCRVLSWPWKRMGLSLLIAAATIHVAKSIKREREWYR